MRAERSKHPRGAGRPASVAPACKRLCCACQRRPPGAFKRNYRRARAAREREINMRSLLTAGLLAGIALGTAAFADDKPYDATTVVATVNGTEITLGNLIALRDRLPQQYQQLPDAVLMKGLIDQMVDQQLLADNLSAKPDTDPLSVKLALQNERRSDLAGLAANVAVAGAVDEAK